ncbi:hypothetical protein T484DRAFT_1824682 [Baffinella frigidus]|nr:hypothetical protein T484DRAFT_1824682 [Cryptophyta sp. CCMP2293]
MAGAVGKGMLRRGWQAYSGALKSHPLRTNLATSGVLTVASDLVAQVSSADFKAGGQIDQTRTATMLGWGVVVTGGFVFHWLRFLDKVFPPAGQTFQRVLTKIAVNQSLMSPGLNGAFFGGGSEARDNWLTAWKG